MLFFTMLRKIVLWLLKKLLVSTKIFFKTVEMSFKIPFSPNYGASQNDDCEAGMGIKFNSSHIFYPWLGCGNGSNTRAKLMAL